MKGHSERNEINNNAIQMGNTPYWGENEWVHYQQLVYRFYNSDINAKSKLNWNWTYLAT